MGWSGGSSHTLSATGAAKVCQESLELSLGPVGTAEGIEQPSSGERPVSVDGSEGEAEDTIQMMLFAEYGEQLA